jgi:head-tail adaptor
MNNDLTLWEERNSTEQMKKNGNNNGKEDVDFTRDIKSDSILKDWKDITNPKRKIHRLKEKDRSKVWYKTNREKAKSQMKVYYEYNKEIIKAKRKERYQLNKEIIKTQIKEYRRNNVEKLRNQSKIRYEIRKNEPQYKLRRILRLRLNKSLNNNNKVGSFVSDLGCTIIELKTYLESKFKEGMTWENHGSYGWHIDHIKPLASFDLTDRNLFLEACHYTNLQPLWWQENLTKGSTRSIEH